MYTNETIPTNGLQVAYIYSSPFSWNGGTTMNAGDTVYDLSGNGRHGTIVNGLTYNSGTGYVEFDADADSISIPNISTDAVAATYLVLSDRGAGGARRNPFAAVYGGEGAMTIETDYDLSVYAGISGANSGVNGTTYWSNRSVNPLPAGIPLLIGLRRNANTLDNIIMNNSAGLIVDSMTMDSITEVVKGGLPMDIADGYLSNGHVGFQAGFLAYDRALTDAEIIKIHNFYYRKGLIQ